MRGDRIRYEEMCGDTNRGVGYKKFLMAFVFYRYKYEAIRGDTGSGEEIRGISGVVRSCKEIGGDPKRNEKMPGE